MKRIAVVPSLGRAENEAVPMKHRVQPPTSEGSQFVVAELNPDCRCLLRSRMVLSVDDILLTARTRVTILGNQVLVTGSLKRTFILTTAGTTVGIND